MIFSSKSIALLSFLLILPLGCTIKKPIAGIEKNVTHYVARHTFATIALNKGIPIEVVQKLLSHTDIKTTQIYAKFLTETMFKEMEKMDEE